MKPKGLNTIMKDKQKKMGALALIKRFLPYYKQYAGVVALDLFCAALTTVCELVLPLIVRGKSSRTAGVLLWVLYGYYLVCSF